MRTDSIFYKRGSFFAKRSIEPDFPHQYRGLLPQLHRVYLDELSVDPQQAIGVASNTLKIGISPEQVALATGLTLEQVQDLAK